MSIRGSNSVHGMFIKHNTDLIRYPNHGVQRSVCVRIYVCMYACKRCKLLSRRNPNQREGNTFYTTQQMYTICVHQMCQKKKKKKKHAIVHTLVYTKGGEKLKPQKVSNNYLTYLVMFISRQIKVINKLF